MSDFILSCCSTADLTKEQFEKRDIHYICYHYELDGQVYADDMGQTMPLADFYAAMRNGAETKTSQINEVEFEEYFEPFLQQGKDILHVTLSSGITGVYNSAMLAKETMEEKYPGRKVIIVDSLGASTGYGMLMDKMADLRDEGMGMEELAQWAMDHRLKMHHWFFSTDLTFYVKGGRISKAAGLFGGILNICPLLNMSFDGRLVPRFKLRGKKKAIEAIEKQMELCADKGLDYDDKVYMCHSDCLEDAKEVAKIVEARFPKMKGKVEFYDIGTTIGSHSGPGTVALFFWGKERED